MCINLFSINKFNNEKERERERRVKEEEDSKMPPGTRLMGEEERIRTLEDL